jgi:hypothetical protein
MMRMECPVTLVSKNQGVFTAKDTMLQVAAFDWRYQLSLQSEVCGTLYRATSMGRRAKYLTLEDKLAALRQQKAAYSRTER